MKISHFILPVALLLVAPSAFAATVKVEGSSLKVIEIAPEANTGLNNIFVVNNTSGCSLSCSVTNGYTAVAYRYSNLGGGYAEEITDVERSASSLIIPLGTSDLGYIIEEGTSRYYCWVVNYANHIMTLDEVSAAEEQECDYSVINVKGNAEAITFYTINGQPRTLSREIYVDYKSQEFQKDYGYADIDVRKVYESLGSVLSVSPPAYCATYFTFSGDRFLREWNMGLTAETGLMQPVAIACSTDAVQEETSSDEGGSNIMSGGDSGLGGSAPADITFYAYTTDAASHYFYWQLSGDQSFEQIDVSENRKEFNYTFDREGTFYVRFICADDDNKCEAIGDTYTVTIGASALECPNAFSPNDDGVNDVWKVSYRSLIDFHCEIFNRNGQKIFGFDNPSDGWDGTWHGKKVKPGVYYYVITATGADSKKYKKSGDINILNTVIYSNGSTAPLD